MGQEMLTLSETPDFTPNRELHDFTYPLYIFVIEFVSLCGLCLLINGLLTWISVTASCRTFLIRSDFIIGAF